MNASFDDIRAMLGFCNDLGDQEMAAHYSNLLKENESDYVVIVLCDDGEEVVYENIRAGLAHEAEEIAFSRALEEQRRPVEANANVEL
jgi:hypothetical protein